MPGPAGLVDRVNRMSRSPTLGLARSQATEKRCARRTVGNGVLFAVAPRDTFTGVGVGRKAGSEAGEAIRWGHSFYAVIVGLGQPEGPTRKVGACWP